MAADRKILLVEDQVLIAMSEAAMLRAGGYSVEIVHSGEMAIEAVRRDMALDIVLMDIDLGPGISGPEAAQQILGIHSLPIVFLTSHSERDMVEKVRNITRYGYVIKNSGKFVLLASIEMAFELFEAHQKVAYERNNIRQVMESIDEAFYLKDSQTGEMLYISPSYETIWGLPLEGLVRNPRSFMAAIHPDDLPEVKERQAAMMAGGPAFDMEYRITRPNGEVRWVRARTKRIMDSAGRLVRYAATAEDVTDRKRAQMDLDAERKRRSGELDPAAHP